MAIKNLFQADVVLHNDTSLVQNTVSPITYTSVYVLGKNPAQVNSKLIKLLGDRLLFIERIQFVGSNDASVFGVENSSVSELVG